jgi:glutamate-5-semialdehyde dehydrogenase
MSVDTQMLKVAQYAKVAAQTLASLSSAVKNELLQRMAQGLLDHTEELIEANEQDLKAAREAGMAA